MPSKAATVNEYLAELPPDRRAAIAALREVMRKNLDGDYEEGMSYGMIGYFVPHRVYPPGYHCNPKLPLPFAGLASQKNYMSLHLMSVYFDPAQEQWLRARFAAAGKKLDMGKACIRFRKLEDLALDVIGDVVRQTPAARYIEQYEKLLGASSRRSAGGAATRAANNPEKSIKAAAKAKKATRAKKSTQPKKPKTTRRKQTVR